ncbi:MAG: DUF4381 domain-containing protein [Methylococcales bacterium]
MDPSKLPLRDWHGPEAVGWWPPAPGWWIVLFAAILLGFAVVWLWRRLTRTSVKKLARKEFKCLRLNPDLSDTDRVRQLSILIRRICLSIYPRAEIAGLTGMNWLLILDKTLDEPSFSEGPGKVLLDAPYRRDAELDYESLFSLCERWIETLPESTATRFGSNSKKAR